MLEAILSFKISLLHFVTFEQWLTLALNTVNIKSKFLKISQLAKPHKIDDYLRPRFSSVFNFDDHAEKLCFQGTLKT